MPPRMLEHLLGGNALPRVKREGPAEQIDALFAHRAESAKVVGPWAHRDDALGLDISLQLANAGPYILGGCTDAVRDELYLVDLGVTGQVRNAQDDLGHHRADTPDINCATVEFGTVQELRRAVPARDDVRGHVAIGIGEGAGKTEISQFDLAVGGNEQVVGLDIAVQNVILVAEPDGPHQHAHPCLDVGRSVTDALLVADKHFQVAKGEVLQDEADVLILCREDREQGDDVGVGQLAEMFQFTNGVGCKPLGILFLLLDFLDGDELGGVGADVAEVDDSISTFTELLA